MLRKKTEDKIDFKKAFENKKIPILTLDERWHQLFPEYEKTSHIKELEKKLNNLMKQQGKEISEIKEMKKLKKKLMDEIVNNMDAANIEGNSLKIRKQEKSQKLIKEINDKIVKYEEELIELPYQIKKANEKLMIESMKICYQRLKNNEEQIAKNSEWVAKVREELKKRILIKQDLEMKNSSIYTYMHDLLGAEAIQIFDNEQGKD